MTYSKNRLLLNCIEFSFLEKFPSAKFTSLLAPCEYFVFFLIRKEAINKIWLASKSWEYDLRFMFIAQPLILNLCQLLVNYPNSKLSKIVQQKLLLPALCEFFAFFSIRKWHNDTIQVDSESWECDTHFLFIAQPPTASL